LSFDAERAYRIKMNQNQSYPKKYFPEDDYLPSLIIDKSSLFIDKSSLSQ
jgi:hypothetical protein